VVDRIVAVIDDDAIFLSDLQRHVRPFEQELQQVPDGRERASRREELYRRTLEQMVDDALIRKAASRAHVSATEADIDRMIDGIARQRGATRDDVYQAIEAQGIPRADYRAYMEMQVLRLRVLNVRVSHRIGISESDINEEYRRRVRAVNDRAPFHAAHVFVAFPDNPTSAQVVAVQRRAEQIAARARAGEDFSALARDYSDDASTRDSGGDLGAIDPNNSQAPPPAWLVGALRDLRPGQSSDATRGENGYHVFRLIGRDAVTIPPLAAVRTELYNELMNREMARQEQAYLRELRRRSAVEVRL
jgi:peptidyl-prolyl cis-trans isomerase SurA